MTQNREDVANHYEMGDVKKPERPQGPHALRRKLRKRFAGSEDTRLRDALRRELRKPLRVTAIDKAAFVMGVVNLMVTQGWLLLSTSTFWLWYVCWFPVLFGIRLWTYTARKWHYFLLDFCYYGNALCLVYTLLGPGHNTLFAIIFTLSSGPLAFAIVVWRNSLVFHSLEHITTLFIHALPPLLVYTYRWAPGPQPYPCENDECIMTYASLWRPLVAYCAWQILYVLKTDVLDSRKLARDASIQTSTRWLTRSRKGVLYTLTLTSCRRFGLFGPKEHLNSEEWKTKIVFMVVQLLYTMFTFLPVPFLFSSQLLHTLYIMFLTFMATWNGASYYVEVFSRIYMKRFSAIAFEQGKQEQQLCEATTDTATQPQGSDKGTTRARREAPAPSRPPITAAAASTDNNSSVASPRVDAELATIVQEAMSELVTLKGEEDLNEPLAGMQGRCLGETWDQCMGFTFSLNC